MEIPIIDDNKKEIVLINEFGICPHCGRQLYLLESNYTLYGVTTFGQPNRIIKNDTDYTAACECGFKIPMVKLYDRIVPRDYYLIKKYKDELEKGKDDNKLIGYIDE